MNLENVVSIAKNGNPSVNNAMQNKWYVVGW